VKEGAYKAQEPRSFIEAFLQLIDESEPVKDPFDHIYTSEYDRSMSPSPKLNYNSLLSNDSKTERLKQLF
jgi:hypothetical protein